MRGIIKNSIIIKKKTLYLQGIGKKVKEWCLKMVMGQHKRKEILQDKTQILLLRKLKDNFFPHAKHYQTKRTKITDPFHHYFKPLSDQNCCTVVTSFLLEIILDIKRTITLPNVLFSKVKKLCIIQTAIWWPRKSKTNKAQLIVAYTSQVYK